jgi:hypothetical protein
LTFGNQSVCHRTPRFFIERPLFAGCHNAGTINRILIDPTSGKLLLIVKLSQPVVLAAACLLSGMAPAQWHSL